MFLLNCQPICDVFRAVGVSGSPRCGASTTTERVFMSNFNFSFSNSNSCSSLVLPLSFLLRAYPVFDSAIPDFIDRSDSDYFVKLDRFKPFSLEIGYYEDLVN